MSYQDYDISEANASPLELIRFVYNDTTYRYCTLDGGVADFTFGAEVYQATTLYRGPTEISEDMQRNSVDIKVPRTSPVAELYFLGPPEGVISVTILRFHANNPEPEYIVQFKGRIGSCSFEGDEAILHCEPIFSSLRRPGLRMVYETQCVHGHYQTGCNLIKDDYKVPGYVLDAEGINIIVQEAGNFPDGWFKSGTFVCGDVRRMIVAHSGVNITLMHPVRTTVIGAECVLYPGCDHTLGSNGCQRYNNAENALIFAWLPKKNPFAGDNPFW